LASLAAPSTAHATFTSPQTLSAAGQSAFFPQVAVDQGGNAVFVWQRFDGTNYRIQARARTAAGVLSATQTLSAPGQDASNPQVGVDQSGDAVFVWSRYDGTGRCSPVGCFRIEARARTAAGVLSATQTLSARGQHAVGPQVAVDQSGNAVFVWQRPDGSESCYSPGCSRIQARARTAAGALSATQTLSAAGQNAYDPQVGIDQSDNAVFVWRRYDGTTGCGGTVGCSRIQARARTAAGALSATQTLSAPPDAFVPQVGVDQSGNAVFVWQRYDGTRGCGAPGCLRIQARARTAAGVLSATQDLSDAGQSAYDPQVGVDQNGNAVFAWRRYDGTGPCSFKGCSRVQARARTAAGVLSATQDLSDAGRHADQPQVGVDQSGNAVFVWRRRDGTTDCDGASCDRIQARARTAAGALSATQTLSAAGQHADQPQVGVDQSGNAAAAWERYDGLYWRIQASVGP
jgi:uncharacterized protein YheU (UPF0270 family)